MKPFPLFKLPWFLRKKVVSLMGKLDQIKISLSSEKGQNLIRSIKHDELWCYVHLTTDIPHIEIRNCRESETDEDYVKVIFNVKHIAVVNQFVCLDNSLIAKSYDKEKPNELYFNNPLEIRNNDRDEHVTFMTFIFWLTWVFRQDYKKMVIKVNPDKVDKESIKSLCRYNDWRRLLDVYILDGVSGTEILGGKLKRSLDVLHVTSPIPVDYYNVKAFVTQKTYYEDARWVKMEYFLTLPVRHTVTLKYTNIDSTEINQFIKRWMISDNNTFRQLNIKFFKNGRLPDSQIVTEGIQFLNYNGVFIKSPTKRRYDILALGVTDGYFTFYSLDRSHNTFKDQYEIFDAMDHRNDLEDKIENLEKEVIKLMKKKPDHLENQQEIRKIELEKEEIQKELNKITRKLLVDYGVN